MKEFGSIQRRKAQCLVRYSWEIVTSRCGRIEVPLALSATDEWLRRLAGSKQSGWLPSGIYISFFSWGSRRGRKVQWRMLFPHLLNIVSIWWLIVSVIMKSRRDGFGISRYPIKERASKWYSACELTRGKKEIFEFWSESGAAIEHVEVFISIRIETLSKERESISPTGGFPTTRKKAPDEGREFGCFCWGASFTTSHRNVIPPNLVRENDHRKCERFEKIHFGNVECWEMKMFSLAWRSYPPISLHIHLVERIISFSASHIHRKDTSELRVYYFLS